MANNLVEFQAQDGIILDGYIHKSNENNQAILIEIHGMGSNCFKSREKIIANEVEKLNIDSLCFNTRGSEIVKTIKNINGTKKLAGTAYENIEESYYDILGAIKYAISLGYTTIYLQGHSLGATKIVYTYNKMQTENNEYVKFIKGLILLSLVDVPNLVKSSVTSEFMDYVNQNKEKSMELIPVGGFVHFMSIHTILQYLNNKNIDFAPYNDKTNKFEILNNINIPIFIRWGSVNELIIMSAPQQVEFMNEKIVNSKKNIGFIDGGNHSYKGKEQVLAQEIYKFLKENL